jgi:sodium-dependent multivitamin transporter 6
VVLTLTLAFRILGGPVLGLFCLGMFVPFANSRGAILGTVASLCCTVWIFVGSQTTSTTTFSHAISYQKKPTLITGCSNLNKTRNQFLHLSNFQTSQPSTSTFSRSTKFMSGEFKDQNTDDFLVFLYSISYTWYGFIAVLVVLVIGSLASLLTGKLNFRIINFKNKIKT